MPALAYADTVEPKASPQNSPALASQGTVPDQTPSVDTTPLVTPETVVPDTATGGDSTGGDSTPSATDTPSATGDYKAGGIYVTGSYTRQDLLDLAGADRNNPYIDAIVFAEALLNNFGDIVLVQGNLYNWGIIVNDGYIYGWDKPASEDTMATTAIGRLSAKLPDTADVTSAVSIGSLVTTGLAAIFAGRRRRK